MVTLFLGQRGCANLSLVGLGGGDRPTYIAGRINKNVTFGIFVSATKNS